MTLRLDSRATRDASIAISITLITAFTLSQLDAYEQLTEFTRAHESWELDEIILTLLISPFTIGWIAIRRWYEAASELKRRQQSELDLCEIRGVLEHQAAHDTLTGLPNRKLLLHRIEQLIASCERYGHHAAVILVNFDKFKHINDSMGHTAGDALLQQITLRLKNNIRMSDFAACLSADEFVILLPNISGGNDSASQTAKLSTEKLQAALSQPYFIDGKRLHLSSAIGITLIHPDSATTAISTEETLKHASAAMARAKLDEGNAIRFFNPGMQRHLEKRVKIQNQLLQALDNQEFYLQYQPKIDASDTVIGVEALLRWQHPEAGNISPVVFIPIAEENGQIITIGSWVLIEALSQLKTWETMGPLFQPLTLSVNVSPCQFRQKEFVYFIKQALVESGARPERLILELTEGVLVENMDKTIEKINALKRLGIRFSMDDFGTGYSSLAYLKRLPVDELKIDRSFIRDIMTDQSDARLVETIITIAGHFGLGVVAEGVENKAQLNFLVSKGCSIFQGFYLGRPQSIEALCRLVASRAGQKNFLTHISPSSTKEL